MYFAVAARVRDLATLRALGFRRIPVIVSVLLETTLLAASGGVIGAAIAIGFVSRLFPAVRVVRVPITVGLREVWVRMAISVNEYTST
jgi:putative ABC transport system permease protein